MKEIAVDIGDRVGLYMGQGWWVYGVVVSFVRCQDKPYHLIWCPKIKLDTGETVTYWPFAIDKKVVTGGGL